MDYKKLIPNRATRLKLLNMCPLPDKMMIRLMYRIRLKKKLDLKDPKTFNEKMQWLKLYDRKPIYTQMVDKYRVREYIAHEIGEEYLIPLLGHWESYDEIDFSKLPDRFVLKCNHDSQSVVIVRDKSTLNHDELRAMYTARLKVNQYRVGREWPYKNIKPCIIAEKYMEDSSGKGDLTDYKIHCFNGEPKAVQVISDRFSEEGLHNDYYTLDWKNYGLSRGEMKNSEYVAPRPPQLEEMLSLARKLSAGIPFLRVDFYVVDGQIYFGELTFFPASGFVPFKPAKWDDVFGSWIQLPE